MTSAIRRISRRTPTRASCSPLSDAEISRSVTAALALVEAPLGQRTRATYAAAEKHFGLESVGIARYAALYRALGADLG